MIKSFRLRLTLWYLAFFCLLLVLFSVFLYGLLAGALRDRLDERLNAEASTAANLFRAELEELNGDAPKAAVETLSEIRPRDVLVVFFSGGGLLASSAAAPQETLDLMASTGSEGETAVAALPGFGPYGGRAAVRRFAAGGAVYRAVAVQSMETIAADLRSFRRLLYICFPLLVVVAGFGGFALATRSLAPLKEMAAQAREITSSSLDRRLEVRSAAAELEVLSASFNELLARLDQSFDTMRRFVADASHELRTPLAVIRGEADVALARERGSAEYRESLAVIQDESRRLCRLLEDLLNLARADAGHVKLNAQDLYLDDLVAECCRTVKPLAEARQVAVECNSAQDVPFQGDEGLLRRMVLNLLDNAIRYTPAGGMVRVSVEPNGAGPRIHVADNGIGIPLEAASHVFERFYRVDKARTREAGGFGLGLSIVKWIAEAHHGSVQMTSSPGAGSTFTVSLPG